MGKLPNAARPENARQCSDRRSVNYFKTQLVPRVMRISVLWCVTREDKVSSFHLLVAGEAGFIITSSVEGLPSWK